MSQPSGYQNAGRSVPRGEDCQLFHTQIALR
jgi:hypothetical protein